MRNLTLATLVSILLGSPCIAGMMGLGGMQGGGHQRGGEKAGGGFGLFGIYDTEATQSYFKDAYSDLVTQYDDGLATIDDYYNSDEYGDVVSNTELLSDRYSLFLDSVGHTIDCFDSMLTSLNQEITFFDDLLAKYQANEDLSAERLERIETWITTRQDILGLKVDIITEKQSVLSENLATYTTFGNEINTHLDTIVAAGGGTTGTEDTATEMAAIAAMAPLYADAGVVAVCEQASATASAVPEPHGLALLLVGSFGLLSRRLRRAV